MKIIKCKISFLFFLTICSCSETPSHEGKYIGQVVMEDGISNITLLLRKNGVATLDGLYGNKVEGTWEHERVGGIYEDDVWATFKFPDYRMKMKLKTDKKGLILADMSARLEGKTILRTMHIKEKNPLLKKM
jgi:hypothetical protein